MGEGGAPPALGDPAGDNFLGDIQYLFLFFAIIKELP